MPVAKWPRPLFQPGGIAADVVYQVFSGQPLPDDLPIDRERHGLPDGEPPEGIFLSDVSAEDAPGWFQRFQLEPLVGPARAALGQGIDSLLGATWCYEVAGEVDDPADLAFLQHAQGVVRCLCELGAGPVYDVHARRWYGRDQVLAQALDRPFDIRAEVSVEQRATDAAMGLLFFTRGLAKLGRPDLVLVRCQPGDEALLWGMAELSAQGVRLEAGIALTGDDGGEIELVPYKIDDAMPDLDIMNDAAVVVRS